MVSMFFLAISLIPMKSCPVILRNLYEIADHSWFGMRLPLQIGASDPSGNGHQPPAKLVNSYLQLDPFVFDAWIDQQKVLDTWHQQTEHIILGLEFRL